MTVSAVLFGALVSVVALFAIVADQLPRSVAIVLCGALGTAGIGLIIWGVRDTRDGSTS